MSGAASVVTRIRTEHRVPRAASRMATVRCRPRDAVARGIDAQLESEAVAPVEGGPLDAHRPAVDDRSAQARWRGSSRARSSSTLPAPSSARWRSLLVGREPGHVGHQQRLLGHPERRSVERLQVPPGVDEVPLDPHRAQHEPAELDRGSLEPSARYSRLRVAPESADLRRCRRPRRARAGRPRVPSGEADALVGRVGPHQHHPPGLRLEVDLHRVPLRSRGRSGSGSPGRRRCRRGRARERRAPAPVCDGLRAGGASDDARRAVTVLRPRRRGTIRRPVESTITS